MTKSSLSTTFTSLRRQSTMYDCLSRKINAFIVLRFYRPRSVASEGYAFTGVCHVMGAVVIISPPPPSGQNYHHPWTGPSFNWTGHSAPSHHPKGKVIDLPPTPQEGMVIDLPPQTGHPTPRPPNIRALRAGGTHPTGMLSCCCIILHFHTWVAMESKQMKKLI